MMKTLGCLLSFILMIFFVLMAFANILWYKIRQFLGLGGDPFTQSRQTSSNARTSSTNSYRQQTNTSSTASANPSHKKVFADDEGEYVDFEEVSN